MIPGPFLEIGLLFGVATLVSLVMRLLRQPLIIGHIITGFLVGHYAIGKLNPSESFYGKMGAVPNEERSEVYQISENLERDREILDGAFSNIL